MHLKKNEHAFLILSKVFPVLFIVVPMDMYFIFFKSQNVTIYSPLVKIKPYTF